MSRPRMLVVAGPPGSGETTYFGRRVGAGEASGHATRSAFGDERTTVTLPDRGPKGPAT